MVTTWRSNVSASGSPASWLRTLLNLALAGLIAGLVVGCGGTTPTAEPTPTDIAGEITFAGSTTLQPLAHQLGEVFQERHPDVTLDIAAGGSVVGIEAIHDGTVDIGMASRALTDEEAEGITQHQVAADVIAMVVNGSNPVEDLALTELRDIYLGRITSWSEVGGPDAPIMVVVRGKNSGTRGAFDKIVLDKQEPAAPDLQTAVAASDVAAMVAENDNAIGYIGFGHFELDIKVIAIDGVMPSEETAQDGSYPVVRPLLFMTGPLSQPIAQDFIDFALSEEGQQMVVDEGWVPAQ
jgi:phosphate transport system substrate-binding protein